MIKFKEIIGHDNANREENYQLSDYQPTKQ